MKLHRLPVISAVSTLFQNPLALVGGVLLCISPIAARGQSVTFAGAQSAVSTVNPPDIAISPESVAVDGAGDLFIGGDSDPCCSSSLWVEYPRTAAGYGQRRILPFIDEFGGFPGLALDGAGDVFASDSLSGMIMELPRTPTGYGPQVTLPLVGLFSPVGVAVDSAGDVFFADDRGLVVELPKTATGYGPQMTLPYSNLQNPQGVASDDAGDVFVADFIKGVLELPRTPTGYGVQIALPFMGLSPYGVAVDSAGDVFASNFGNHDDLELPKTPTGYGPQMTLPFSGLSFHRGIAVDGVGDVFLGDTYNARVLELQTVAVDFWGANVCASGATTPAPCRQTLTLNYNVNVDTTLGEPQVATGGLKHLDFDRASGSTCIGAVTAGTTCTVKVNFAPLAAGFRHGSVSLADISGHVITTIQLSGFGIAATGAPVAQLSTSKLSFGAIDFSATKTLSLFVANIGGGTLTVAPSISGPSYKIANSTCAAGVTPGNSCTLVVEYSPVSIGTHDDTLTVATNGGSPTVGLFGSVVGLSVLGGVSGATLEFGTLASGSTEVLPLTVTNVGLPGTVMVGTAISGLSFSILTTGQNTCLAGITAGQSCTLPVQFAPTNSGLHDDLLTLTSFPGGGATTVWLTGSTP